jgi:autotransporter-associated beta strand protein
VPALSQRSIIAAGNSYSGGTVLNAGTLRFDTAASVPAAGTITLAAGSTLGFGFELVQATLAARVGATANAFILALGTSSGNNFDLTNYTGASLGAFGTISYSGSITPGGSTYRFGGGGGTLTVSSPLSGANAIEIGSAGGGGNVVLTGTNSFTGGATISSGTLRVGNASALGSPANALTVTSTLDLNGYNVTVGSLTSGAAAALVTDNSAAPGTTTFTDKLASGSTTYSGSINNGANGRLVAFVKDGAGTLIVNKANGSNYTGGTFLAGGLLDVRVNNAQVLPNGSDVTFTGNASLRLNNNGTGVGSLVLGALSFAADFGTVTNWRGSSGGGSNISFTGLLTRANGAAGNLNLGNSAPAGYRFIFTSGSIPRDRFLNGGVYYEGADFAVADTLSTVGARALNYDTDVNVANAALSSSVLSLAIGAGGSVNARDVRLGGTGAVTAQSTETIHSLKIAGANNVTLAAGATLTISSGGLLKAGGNASVISGGTALTTGGPGDLVIRTAAAADSLTISSVISATNLGGVTKSGDGTLILSGSNAYSGVTSVLEGTLQIASTSALGSTADGTTIFGGGTLDVAGLATGEAVQINSGTLQSSIGAGGAVSGAVTLTGSATANVAASATLTLGNGVSGDGTLTKTGAGTLVLSGANTYQGLTTISAGIVNLRNSTALGNTGAGTLITSGATLQIQGGIHVGAEALTVGGAGASGQSGALVNIGGTNTYGGLLTLGSASTISSNSGSLSLTHPGTITGPFGLTLAGSGDGRIASIIGTAAATVIKNGNGTWTLSGANTYAGLTTVNAGTLEVTNAAALGSAAAGVTVAGAGTLKINNVAVGGEAVTLNGGTVVGVGMASSAGTIALGSNVGIINTPSASDWLTLSGTLTGTTGGITKTGAGSLVLTGGSSYAGGTDIQDGSIRVAVLNALLPTSAAGVTLGSGNTSGTLIIGGDGQGGGVKRDQTLRHLLTSGLGTANRVVGGAPNGTDDGNPAGNSTLNLNIAIGSTDTYDGFIGGTGTFENNINLVKRGPGTLELTQDLTNWTGIPTGPGSGPADPTRPSLTVSGGVLRLRGTATINTAMFNTGGLIDDQGFTRGPNQGLRI